MKILLGAVGMLLAWPGSLAAEKFVVHEWGVQVRGMAQGEPILSAAPELLSGLPEFVGRNQTPLRFEAIGWDKPVIHFYGSEGLEIKVEVGTPTGIPLAYYPLPILGKGMEWGSSGKRMMAGKLHFASDMEWSGRLRAEAPRDLPQGLGGHWWRVAREIPSAYLESAGGSERFVFYEATAAQEPVISVQVSKTGMELSNLHKERVGPVVIILNDGTGIRGAVCKTVKRWGRAVIKNEEFQKWGDEEVLRVCREQWSALGMTEVEAEKIVEIWRSDLLERLGVMVISPMPQSVYDEMFPLRITPQPDEIVRAGLVFDTLNGQANRSAWLPGLEATLREAGRDLANEEFPVRARAKNKFRTAGDLALQVLDELAESKDPEVSVAARDLAGVIREGNNLGVQAVRPTKENAEGLVELLHPEEHPNGEVGEK